MQSTEELEREADRLLGLNTGRPGRKIAHEYPILSERQLKSRRDKEVCLGEKQVSAFPGESGHWLWFG